MWLMLPSPGCYERRLVPPRASPSTRLSRYCTSHLPGCAAPIARAAARGSSAAGGAAPSAALRRACASRRLGPRRRSSLGSRKSRLVAIITSGNSPSCHVKGAVRAAACSVDGWRGLWCGGREGGEPARATGCSHGRARRAPGPRDGPAYRAARSAARAAPGPPLRRPAKPAQDGD